MHTCLPYSLGLVLFCFGALLCWECTCFFLYFCPNLPALKETQFHEDFLTPQVMNTHTNTHTESYHSFYLPLFYLLLDFCLFPPYQREDLFLLSSFPLCVLDNTGVTIIYIYYHCPCHSYFIAKWWEMQKLLSKYITRKQETWKISRSILFRDAKRRALFTSVQR